MTYWKKLPTATVLRAKDIYLTLGLMRVMRDARGSAADQRNYPRLRT